MVIREAVGTDLVEVTEIFNEVLLNSTAIYRDDPTTVEERTDWWRSRQRGGFPLLIAEDEGVVMGFATYGQFRPWPGYGLTVESTIHLRPTARRHGIGSELFRELIEHARNEGKHMMIAGVDSENHASIRFMEKFGATRCGQLREVGFKFGRFLDLIYFQLPLSRLNEREASDALSSRDH